MYNAPELDSRALWRKPTKFKKCNLQTTMEGDSIQSKHEGGSGLDSNTVSEGGSPHTGPRGASEVQLPASPAGWG